MSDVSGERTPARESGETVRMMVVGTVLLRHRRLILILGFLGALGGGLVGLLSARTYTTSAIILPEAGENGASSGLALAASQFGIKMPLGDAGWAPPIYVELLESRALLERALTDTLVVAEEDGRRTTLMDLLEVEGETPALRLAKAVREARKHVSVSEDRSLGAVRLSVRTEWPSVSLAVAERLVSDVERFNVESRQSRAMAERRFVEEQAAEAEAALRAAEDDLQLFLQRNRVLGGSPELDFRHDRLKREVTLRQQVYTMLAENLGDAKIREVRDTPVITLLAKPMLMAEPDRRGVIQKVLLGGLAGGMLAVLFAFLAHGLRGARLESDDEAREFFGLVDEATPRFLRRRFFARSA